MMLGTLAMISTLFASDGAVANQDEFGQFLSKLSQLQRDSTAQLRVFQIGDSHLQAGFFGGRLRERFQKLFGSAGRGLAFPHHLGGSNSAYDLRWASSSRWASSNAIRKDGPFPWGLSGWSIRSGDSEAELDFRLASSDGAIDSFAQVTVIGDFDRIEVSDSARGWIKRDSSRMSFTAARGQRTDRFHLKLQGSNPRLDGIVLQSARSGILWSDAGVNGMTWPNLLKPSFLWKQLQGLDPDLVVISLGTNDAWNPKFDETTFRRQVGEVLHRIDLTAPNANIMLTLPPDHALKAGSRKTAPNPRLGEVIRILREQCDSGKATCVDLRQLMGGEGSWKDWTAKGLMTKDHVHYTKPGYFKQADLIADALLALPASDSARKKNIDPVETARFLASQDSLLAATNWSEARMVDASKKPEKISKKKEKKPAKVSKKGKSTKDRKVSKKSKSKPEKKKRKKR